MEGVHLAGVGNFLAICWGGGWKINNSWSRGVATHRFLGICRGGRENSVFIKKNK